MPNGLIAKPRPRVPIACDMDSKRISTAGWLPSQTTLFTRNVTFGLGRGEGGCQERGFSADMCPAVAGPVNTFRIRRARPIATSAPPLNARLAPAESPRVAP